MIFTLFPKLAWNGIRKNKKLYTPYILTCIGMVMMSYIMQSLSYSPLLMEMRGGRNLELILSLGKFVIAAFALLFLFYTNSFVIRRRNREFGLYNVLGMGKGDICAVVFWESLYITVIGLGAGIALGIALSKLGELGLLNAIKADIDYKFTVAPEAVFFTLEVFGTIFLILFVRSLLGVIFSKPMSLLKSENVGEKAPRANWVIAAIGVIILGTAYYLSVSIQSPMTALLLFFVAVIMVIVATYLIFISGSVALCRILQKNKKYYYKKNHFVSVSSMVYRMKRNGAGLASICILSTMVLVMISSTSSLYFGMNDVIASRFPMENEIAVSISNSENTSAESTDLIKKEYDMVFEKYGVKPDETKDFCYSCITGLLTDTYIEPDKDNVAYSTTMYDSVRSLYFVKADDYNREMGTDISLHGNDVLIYPYRCTYDADSLTVDDLRLNITGTLDKYPDISDANVAVMPSFMILVNDFDTLAPLESIRSSSGEKLMTFKYYYGWNLDADDDTVTNVFDDMKSSILDIEHIKEEDGGYSYLSGCLVYEKSDFLSTFGGLFFVGIMLSIVFIFAAVMIIYYKQVSEGYEDRAKFDIMQKVGMTKADIKKSINSQVLTVFFAPLLFAGVHLSFAFPLVWKLLQLFHLSNLSLVIAVTVIAFAAFSILYAIVYKITARAYYSIVSGAGD